MQTDAASDAQTEFFESVDTRVLLLNVEYKAGSLSYVTLLSSDEKEDVGKELVLKGFTFVDRKRDKRFQKLLNDYLTAQESAKKSRVSIYMIYLFLIEFGMVNGILNAKNINIIFYDIMGLNDIEYVN